MYWRRRYLAPPRTRLVRYVDDVAVFCPSPEAAEAAGQHLVQRLRPAGFRLKGEGTGVHKLGGAGGADCPNWLGFRLGGVTMDRLKLRIGERAWHKLGANVAARVLAGAPAGVAPTILGWLDQVGPTWLDEDQEACLDRLAAIQQDAGATSPVTRYMAQRRWHKARMRWSQGRRLEAAHLEAAGANLCEV
jgi:hypothetical protein